MPPEKMILGIYHPANGVGHDSSVALIDMKGRILAAHSEERFSRIKMDGGFPFRAMEQLRKMIPFGPENLEAVAIPYWDMAEKGAEAARIAAKCLNPVFGKTWFEYRSGDVFQKEMEQLGAYRYLDKYMEQVRGVQAKDKRPALGSWQDFLKHEGLESVPLVRVDHHIAHVAGAYFTAGWPEALVITADGAGAMKSGMVAVCSGGKIKVIARTFLPHSPGRFWEIITHVCGFHHHKHGGKITGLAASGNKNAACYEIMKKALWQSGLEVRSDLHPAKLAEALKDVPREDIAATAQRRLEEVLTGLAAEAVGETGIGRIALAGGVFGNVLLNQKIRELPGVKDLYIFPAMGDEGLAAGAALWALSRRTNLAPYRFDDVYCGPGYSDAETLAALREAGLKYEKLNEEEMINRVVDDIVAHKVVAYFDGRMEFGPRALGHRTILYATTDASVNQWLNDRLHRSEFMPFAPVTLAEKAAECYEGIPDNHYPAQFMTLTYQCTADMKKKSPAVVHLDGTARPQLVSEKHGRYYKILKEYHRRTGIASLVNTSFNMHEEPIVATPEDAVRAFLDGGLDVLVLGDYRVEASKK